MAEGGVVKAELMEWITPVALAAGGLAVGWLVEKILLRRLRGAARRTGWGWDDLLVDSLRGSVLILFGAAGLYAALVTVELGDEVRTFVGDALTAAVIFALTLAAARIAGGGVRLWMRSSEGRVPSSSLIQNVARILVFGAGILLILQNLGYRVSALLAGLGIGGLAVALALQDTLSNLFAGFQIILARQVRQGDYVRLESGQEGYVTDIQWRNSTIASRVGDHEVVVPNSKLAGAIVTNFARPRNPFWVRVEVGVAYDSDLDEVERVTLEVAREVKEEFGVEELDEAVFRFREFGSWSVNFAVRIRVDEYTKQFRMRHAFIKRLHARFGREGIEIPFPIRTLYAPRGLDVRGEGEGAVRRGGGRS